MKTKKKNDPVHCGKWLNGSGAKEAVTGDPLAIEAVDYVEIYSGNAKQSAYFYIQTFGFEPVAYRGPETGYRDGVTYVLQQGKITFLISSPLKMDNPLGDYTRVHGDSVKDTAFRVPNCEAFYYEAMKRGAFSYEPPTIWEDSNGSVKRAAIRTYGDVIHSIVERKDYTGNFWPGYVPYGELFTVPKQRDSVGLLEIDHVVGNVELGEMQTWANFYEGTLGFSELAHFTDKDISTEYSALMSKVVTNGNGKIKLPINEPAEGKKKSQIEEYLDFHNGPGVQHVAFLTADIIKTIASLRERGVDFLYVPGTYYEEIVERVGTIDEDMQKLAELGILIDRDEDGYLLQLFTRPVQDRPTLFFEIIQRHGSQGFGVGNFKALFVSIEEEQARRGNL